MRLTRRMLLTAAYPVRMLQEMLDFT